MLRPHLSRLWALIALAIWLAPPSRSRGTVAPVVCGSSTRTLDGYTIADESGDLRCRERELVVRSRTGVAVARLAPAHWDTRHLQLIGRDLWWLRADGSVAVTSLKTGRIQTVYAEPVASFRVSPDGKNLAVVQSSQDMVVVRDLRQGYERAVSTTRDTMLRGWTRDSGFIWLEVRHTKATRYVRLGLSQVSEVVLIGRDTLRGADRELALDPERGLLLHVRRDTLWLTDLLSLKSVRLAPGPNVFFVESGAPRWESNDELSYGFDRTRKNAVKLLESATMTCESGVCEECVADNPCKSGAPCMAGICLPVL